MANFETQLGNVGEQLDSIVAAHANELVAHAGRMDMHRDRLDLHQADIAVATELALANQLALAEQTDISLELAQRVAALENVEPPVDPPVDPPTGEPIFLSRPRIAPLLIENESDVVIEGKTIMGDDPYNVEAGQEAGIILRNCTNVTIRDMDLANLRGGILMQHCNGLLDVSDNRVRNMGRTTQANEDIGSGGGAFIQLAESQFDGFIARNRILGGQTQDVISTWRSGGYGVGQELIIEDNEIEGLLEDRTNVRAWASHSGTGIIISDGAGEPYNGNVIVRRNTLLNAACVGIQHIDGPNIQTYDNIIYGERYEYNNCPMASWEGSPYATLRNNRWWFERPTNWSTHEPPFPAAGWQSIDPWFHGPGDMDMDGSNYADPNIDPESLRVVL